MAEEKKNAPAKKTAAKKPVKKAAPKKTAAKKTAAKSGKTLRVTQVGSAAGRLKKQERVLIGLGLNKMHRTRELEDTPAIRGMIEKVKHLVRVEDVA